MSSSAEQAIDRARQLNARLLDRSRLSLRGRTQRWRSKLYVLVQCALAAGVAWFLAADLVGHDQPFFAPIAAVVSLGTSYGQRLRRVVEVTLGVALGVFVADVLVAGIGSGAWQLALIVFGSMSVALLLDAGAVFVNQAAVQSIVVAALVPGADGAFLRWTDALIGGAVALVAATLVPAAPLRRPREQAAEVTRTMAGLLRAASEVMVDGEVEPALDLLADARATDRLIRELQAAASEGMSVVSSSPFRSRHREPLRRLVELVDPLDRALRSTRVLVRQTSVAAYRRRPVPSSYARLTAELADAVEAVAAELDAARLAEGARDALLRVAAATTQVERSDVLTAEAILVQVRSVIADLLMVTGLGQLEATDAIPPIR